MIVLCRIRAVTVRFKGRDQRTAGLEGFFKTLDIARQSVIKAVQRPDIENDLFLRDFFASLVCDPDRLDQAQIWLSIIGKTFNVHDILQNRPIDLLYNYIINQ